MANTTNFNWETPDDTDLVKDGAAAIRTLGSSIDTSFVDLKGGTTGQNLRKASNTDLDFTFAGDATNTVIDAEGDLLVGDSADTLQRLAIGSNGNVLTVDTSVDGKIKWAAAAGGGGKVLQVVSATYSTETTNSTDSFVDTGLSATITPSLTSSKILILTNMNAQKNNGNADNGPIVRLLRGATTLVDTSIQLWTNSTAFNRGMLPVQWLDSPSTTSATTYKTQFRNYANAAQVSVHMSNAPGTIILMEIGA